MIDTKNVLSGCSAVVFMAALMLQAACSSCSGDNGEGDADAMEDVLADDAGGDADGEDVPDDGIDVDEQEDVPDIDADDGVDAVIPENEVRIYRDIYGVPHIYGGSNRAMFFGHGYAQAEDHLEVMLTNYRTVMGTMAEAFGPVHDGLDNVESDSAMRLLAVARIVEEKYDDMAAEAREAAEAFAHGVNHYMDLHPDKTPSWAAPVTPYKVAAWIKMVQLSRPYGRLKDDIRRGLAEGPEAPESAEGPSESNEWVVGPGKTADGHVMVQIDPHLGWTGMNSWYEVHLESDDYSVAGATLWGTPPVMQGHNDRVAWAMTANSPDTADAYFITVNPDDPHRYWFDGEWRDMEVINETIDVAEGDPVDIELRYTRHGPIVYFDDDVTYAGRMSTWQEVGMLNQILAMNRARDIHEFEDGLRMRQAVRWNFAAGDVNGDILYVWNARVFHRLGDFDYRMPVDGSISDTEWGELVSYDELPREANPESEFFQNCNVSPWHINPLTAITEGDYPDYVTGGSGLGARGVRSTNLIDAATDLTVEDMMAISLDNFSLVAEVLIPMLQYAYENEGDGFLDPDGWLPRAMAVIDAWDFEADVDSVEIALARMWIADVTAAMGGVSLIDPPPPEDLTAGEMRAALSILIETAERMNDLYDSLTVRWGDIHVLERGDVTLPLSGAGQILSPLHMAHGPVGGDGIMRCNGGSSYMMLIQLSDPVRAWSQFPLSESDDPESPHYADISELYSRQEYKPAWFTLEEILDNLDPVDPNPLVLTLPD